MPGRLIPLVIGEYYHVYNRGSEKKNIFSSARDYRRFLQTVFYYQFLGPKPKFSNLTKNKFSTFQPSNDKKLVEILSYCLMPNHFHFLLRQEKENGIAIFISQLVNSYTKYFNVKYERIGALLQGAFKSVIIENDEQLIHVSRYIHLNPLVAQLVENLNQYQWSSYQEYMSESSTLVSTKEILGFFPSREKYKEFLQDRVDYSLSLKNVEHKIFDEI